MFSNNYSCRPLKHFSIILACLNKVIMGTFDPAANYTLLSRKRLADFLAAILIKICECLHNTLLSLEYPDAISGMPLVPIPVW